MQHVHTTTHTHIHVHVHVYTMYVGVGDGLVAEVPNPAVSSTLMLEIQQLKVDGLSEQDIFSRLRSRTVPAGYAFTTWKPGMITMSVVHVCT